MATPQLTLRDYLSQNRTPSKILCIDEKVSYHLIPISHAYLPVCANMIVDHVELDFTSSKNDVVYVRVPAGMKVG